MTDKKLIAVFPSNKILSTDTILPVMWLIHKKEPDTRIVFYIVNKDLYEALKNNCVLWEMMHEMGPVKLLFQSAPGFFQKIIHRFRKLSAIFTLSAKSFLIKTYFFHTGVLNSFPYRFLYYFDKKRTCYFQPNAWGRGKYAALIANVKRIRPRYTGKYSAGFLLSFDASWDLLDNPDLSNIPRYSIPPSRSCKTWLSEIRQRSDEWFSKAFNDAGIPDNQRIIVFILSSLGIFDFLEDASTSEKLFNETMDTLLNYTQGTPIFIKPHAITDMLLFQKFLSRYQDSRIVVTSLHPNVLATRAKFFVANHYSTVFADALAMGIPTVEYTEYTAAALKLTNGNSMAPDRVSYFINRDLSVFQQVVSQLANSTVAVSSTLMVNDDPCISKCFH